MGTTRIKVIDLSGEKEQIKTSRKHARLASLTKRAEKLTVVAKIKAAGPGGPLARGEAKKVKAEVSKETKEPKIEVAPSAPSVSSQPPRQKEAPREITRRRHLGKKYLLAKSKIDSSKLYSAHEAIELLSETSITRFDPTVEIHLNVAEKNLQGQVKLPHAINNKKETRILIFSDQKPETSDQRQIWADEKTIDEIARGKLKPKRDFDKVISTPKFMPALAKIAKILGPTGLMPNPKNGTIIDNSGFSPKKEDANTIEYKTDPNAPIVHLALGKLSSKTDRLEQNLKTLVNSIGPSKIKKATIKTTMSPPVKIDIASLSTA